MDSLALFLDDEDLLVYILFKWTTERRIYHILPKCEELFCLDNLTDDYCWIHFRFYKSDLLRLKTALQIPHTIKCQNRSTFGGMEGLCILLKRLIYPTRHADMMKYFPRTRCEISRIVAKMISFLLSKHHHLLTNMNQNWLTNAKLDEFTKVLAAKGCPYKECFGFLDGTVRPVCRPTKNQRAYYNGHKRVHAIKFQSVSLPNGLIANLHGPVHGRRHDSYLLQSSGIIQQMQTRFYATNGRPYHLYGDPAYPLQPHLITPFQTHMSTPDMLNCNKIMSSVRVSVEWGFGKLVRYFGFLDFKKNLKIALQPVHNYYQIGALLTNCHTCVYGSQTSTFFNCEPPSLEDYIS